MAAFPPERACTPRPSVPSSVATRRAAIVAGRSTKRRPRAARRETSSRAPGFTASPNATSPRTRGTAASSTIHDTVSPRASSLACPRGKGSSPLRRQPCAQRARSRMRQAFGGPPRCRGPEPWRRTSAAEDASMPSAAACRARAREQMLTRTLPPRGLFGTSRTSPDTATICVTAGRPAVSVPVACERRCGRDARSRGLPTSSMGVP